MKTNMIWMFEAKFLFPFILCSFLMRNYFHLEHLDNDLQS